MDYDSRTEIKKVLTARGLGMSKRFGQNFLVCRQARERIVSVLAPGSSDIVWEIGPGIGAMTDMVLRQAGSMVLFEIDHGFADYLAEFFGRARPRIVRGDFLRTWPAVYAEGSHPDLIFGNLPYSCAAAMIGDLIEADVPARRMVFTVQREVAARMVAVPDTKTYSAFSLVCTYRHSVRRITDLPPSMFYPVPEVTSTIVELIPRQETPWTDRRFFFSLVKILFASRRKTIRNNLKAGYLGFCPEGDGIESALSRAGIDGSARAESLSVEDVARLTEEIAGC